MCSKEVIRSAIERALQIVNASTTTDDVEAAGREMLADCIDDAERAEIARAITIAHKILRAGRTSKAKHKGKGEREDDA